MPGIFPRIQRWEHCLHESKCAVRSDLFSRTTITPLTPSTSRDRSLAPTRGDKSSGADSTYKGTLKRVEVLLTSQWKVHSGLSGRPSPDGLQGSPLSQPHPPGRQGSGAGERRSAKWHVGWRCRRGLVQVFFLNVGAGGGWWGGGQGAFAIPPHLLPLFHFTIDQHSFLFLEDEKNRGIKGVKGVTSSYGTAHISLSLTSPVSIDEARG